MTSKQDKTINNPSKTVQKNADAKTLAKRAPSKYASRLSAKGSEATPEAVASRCLLPVKQLKRHSDPASLPLSTDLAEPLDIKFGQQRAIKAITTALNIKASGYHVFAAGENGLGKRTLITRLLTQIAQNQPTPNDWVYVHNFNQPRSPIALSLPPSQASKLKQTMDELWRVAKQRLTQRFRSDSYQSQIEAINNKTHQQEAAAYEALDAEGKQFNLTLSVREYDNKAIFVSLSDAVADSPLLTNQRLSPKDAAEVRDSAEVKSGHTKLTDPNLSSKVLASTPDKSNPNKDVPRSSDDAAHSSATHSPVTPSHQQNHMQKRLNQLTIALEQLEDEANALIDDLNDKVATRVLQPLFTKAKAQFPEHSAVLDYLNAVMKDMIQHVEAIVNDSDDAFRPSSVEVTPSRYAVNVLVSHPKDSGAPIVFEDLPTHLNLLGHVEQVTQHGTVMTDVSMIRAGALHRANGGYLLLEASHLLEHPYAWQGLKRALQSKHIKLSSLEQMLTLTGSLSLAPQAIALDVKVILIGEPDLYYELLELEPEFDAVFKIRADFHDEIPRSPESEQALVAKMADIIRSYQLLPFNQQAQAAIIDHLSLQAENQNKLSLHSDRLMQLLQEANRHATIRLHDKPVNELANLTNLVDARDVQRAIDDSEERSSYLKELYWEELKDGQQLIDTQGMAVGQINALTVISYADTEFGMPARLTALIQPNIGTGEILDIERDVELGGSLHAKGMLIMTSYLRALFSQHHALNFSASLAFEQSYAHIDGDSATLAEACALLSALADVPIKQSLAITGSMNQLGEVQAVGGINAKIAGFFDACCEQGFTGEQGVIIPKANVSQLMLREDIIQAVKNQQFFIYGVASINEALALLTDLPVIIRTKKGRFSKKSLFGKIVKRLETWEANDLPEQHAENATPLVSKAVAVKPMK